MSQHATRIEFSSPEETCAFACALAPDLTAGDTILLAGEVGAGKTHFARCLIQSQLAEAEDIPSPTFTLVQIYDTAIGDIWHADLYRVTNIAEIEELGLYQAFEDAVCLVEWPDRLGKTAPDTALTLHLDARYGDDRRVVTLSWNVPSWGEKMARLLNV